METFILFTLKSSLCLSAGYLLYYLLLRRYTFHRFKRFTLIGIIACSLLLPLIRINLHPTVMNIPVQKLESTIVTETPAAAVAAIQALRKKELKYKSLQSHFRKVGSNIS